ncbi:MAG: insulinase family protein [Candidatus Scalindua sp.]|nr:insulinase family protein [Candidatus Scalindua sp.]MBT6052315.1 insulinase family protein [Candidatus Scalindua sp.]MBT6229733.1 insulinase family protein [Candidatus Scalindua sp.]MBT6562455.1 insulinase family protein [Candidatus Scalindua sp.]MBT7210275.1 insulinase family protein [Candidatus Scalindua sp.]
MLKPDNGKLSSPVLSRESGSNARGLSGMFKQWRGETMQFIDNSFSGSSQSSMEKSIRCLNKAKVFLKCFIILLAVCVSGTEQSSALERKSVNSDPNGSKPFMEFQNITKRKLDNGLTVIVKEDHSSPVATVNVWVKTGYFNEQDEWTGISHLLEHMFFKGTKTRPVGEIQNEVRSVGGYWNASTYYERTNYYIVVPSSSIFNALDIEADCLKNSNIDPGELDKEHEVVIQEILRKYDKPGTMAWEKMMALAYKRHHIGRWRMGTPEQVRSMRNSVLVDYYKKNYCPENIILVVVGDVDTSLVIPKIDKLFGPIPGGTLDKHFSPEEPPQTELRYRQTGSDITQSYVAIGFHAPPALHKDKHAVEALSQLMGKGKSSYLFRTLKQQKELVNDISAGYDTLANAGTFYIEAELPTKNMLEAQHEIFKLIDRIKNNGIAKSDLDKVKTSLEYDFITSMEGVRRQSNTLAYYESLGNYELLRKYVDKLHAVTVSDISRVAAKYLSVDKASIQEYRPENEMDDTTAEKVKNNIKHGIEIRNADETDADVSMHELSNGIRIVIKERHGLPVVSLGIYFEGGRLSETSMTAGLTKMTLNSSLKGTTSREAEKVQDEIAALGFELDVKAFPDYSGYIANGLSRNLLKAFDIIADVIINPVFSANEVEKVRKTQIARIKKRKDNMYYHPMELARYITYGKHSYGLPVNGFEETVEKFTQEQILKKYKTLIRNEHAMVVVVGDVETSAVLKMLENKLQDMPSRLSDEIQLKVKAPKYQTGENIVKRHKSQSAQAFAFFAPSADSEKAPALNVLKNIASGMGGRLYNEVREKNNLAYTVRALLELNKYGGIIINYAATLPENEEKARDMILKEWGKMVDGEITEKEFENAIKYTIGKHQISLETNAALRNQYAQNVLTGRGLNYIKLFPDLIRATTLNQVKSAAAKFAKPDKIALGVVRSIKEEAGEREKWGRVSP